MDFLKYTGAVNFSRKLETESAAFYEALAERFTGDAEMFIEFAKENGVFITRIERSYYGVNADAVEGCFEFHLETGGHRLGDAFSGRAGRTDALKTALEMEEKIIGYYRKAAEQLKPFMDDDGPGPFDTVLQERSERIHRLKALLKE